MVGARGEGRRPAGVRLPQRPRHRGPAGRDARPRRRRRLVLASLDGGLRRGPLRLRRARPAGRRGVRIRAATSTAGDFENHCPVCGTPLGWALVDEDARLDPRSSYAASKVAQEHYASAWVRQAGGVGGRAALPQRLRPGDAPRHAVLRRRGDLPLRARARRGAAGLRGRRPDARLRARRRRRARQRARPATRCVGRAPESLRGVQRLLAARRSRSATSPRCSSQAADGPAPDGDRRVPPRRRPPHRRLARARPRGPRLPRRDRARTRAWRASRRTRSAPDSPVGEDAGAARAAPPRPGPRGPGGASARAGRPSRAAATARTAARSARPRALLIREASASSDRQRRGPAPAAAYDAGSAAARRATSRAEPGTERRPGADGQGGQVAPPPVRRAGGPAAMPGPVAVVERRVGRPSSRKPSAAKHRHRHDGAERDRRERPPRPAASTAPRATSGASRGRP